MLKVEFIKMYNLDVTIIKLPFLLHLLDSVAEYMNKKTLHLTIDQKGYTLFYFSYFKQ